MVIPLKAKSEVFDTLKRFKVYAEILGIEVAALQDHKGGEYVLNAMKAFSIEHGIARQHTVWSPQQNGAAY